MRGDSGNRSVWRGVLAGSVGGLLGSLVMKAWIVGMRRAQTGAGGMELDQSGPAHQVAEMAAQKATGTSFSQRGRAAGGEMVHYAFGALVGGFYGGLGESWTWVRWGGGTLFGTGVFLAADEFSLPLLNLGNKPSDETLEAQAQHWLAHVAFGVSTELARRVLGRMLENHSDGSATRGRSTTVLDPRSDGAQPLIS